MSEIFNSQYVDQLPILQVVDLGETLAITVGIACQTVSEQIVAELSAHYGKPVELAYQIGAAQLNGQIPQMAAIKNIIAVASGKGGVGKSTSAVNLALALKNEGARVGILDADIYGPSIGKMLGVAEGIRPEPVGDKEMAPLVAHGIQSMSMAYLVTEETPMAWRGPMVSGALQQLLTQTRWDDLDYLIIDMPPGTGDIQLTLSQKVPVSGAVVVTTPQEIATLDAKKGIEMFAKVNVPVLGIAENMAQHVCTNCGHVEHIFGSGGGQAIADRYNTALLASLPLEAKIREQADGGQPTAAADSQSPSGQAYQRLARNVAASLANQAVKQAPNISFE